MTFTILHTNDIHSNLIGVGPASEYTPATLNDDNTIGGIERIATLIAERRRAREADGPVLVLDIGDVEHRHPLRRCEPADRRRTAMPVPRGIRCNNLRQS